MSEIYPFRAVFYNPEIAKDYSKVIAPIEYRASNIDYLRDLKDKNDFNIVHLTNPVRHEMLTSDETTVILNKKDENLSPEDALKEYFTEQESIFNQEKAKKFYSWLEDENLFLDEIPGVYPHQREIWNNSLAKIEHQQGLFALLKIEDLNESSIRLAYTPSESLVDQALNQLRNSLAQFSPIVFGFSDPKNSLQSFLKHHYSENPSIQAYDDEGYLQSLWAIHDEGAIDAVQKIFDNFNLVILEGAHYYLAAQKFRDEMKRLEHFGSDTENVENLLGYFVALDGQQEIEIESTNKMLPMNNVENLKIREPRRIRKLRKIIEKNPNFLNSENHNNDISDLEKKQVENDCESDTKDKQNISDEAKTEPAKRSIFRKQSDTQDDDPVEISEADRFWVSFDTADFMPISANYIKLAAGEFFDVEEHNFADNLAQTYNKAKELLSINEFRKALIILPEEKKLLQIQIKDFEKLKPLIPTRKSKIFSSFDIYIFWKYLLHKIYHGFSDKVQSVACWDFKNFCNTFGENSLLSDSTENLDLLNGQKPEKLILEDIKTTSSFLLTQNEQKIKYSNSGLIMLFNPPKGADLIAFADDGDNIFPEQLFRLKFAPSAGLVTYRYDFSNENES